MKTRHFLTVAEKIEILDFYEKNKEISMRNLSAIFTINMKKLSQKVLFTELFTLRCSILKVSHIKFVYNFKYYLNARLKKICSRQADSKNFSRIIFYSKKRIFSRRQKEIF